MQENIKKTSTSCVSSFKHVLFRRKETFVKKTFGVQITSFLIKKDHVDPGPLNVDHLT